MTYRLYVNADRTVFVRIWENGRIETANREDSNAVWGPPAELEEEEVPVYQ